MRPRASSMIRRALVVVTAYVLSMLWGLPSMLIAGMALMFNDPFGPGTFAPLVWLGAWVCHVVMSVAWVRGRRVSRRWPAWGTAAGGASLFTPLLTLLGPPPLSYGELIESSLITTGVAAVFMSPCILLALWLVRYHWQAVGATPHA